MSGVKQQTVLMVTGVIFLSIAVSIGTNEAGPDASKDSEGFTFFEVGANTLFSDRLRRDLTRQLGSDSIEERSTLELSLNQKGFLEQHFPALAELNGKLNAGVETRKQHNTIKLMYRYVPKTHVPFDYVELIFSNYSKKPLMIAIFSKQEGSTIANTLKSKYGEPLSIVWNNEKGKSLYWTKNDDVLILSFIANRFDRLETHIRMYFTDNIRELADREQTERQKREEEKTKGVKEAF